MENVQVTISNYFWRHTTFEVPKISFQHMHFFVHNTSQCKKVDHIIFKNEEIFFWEN